MEKELTGFETALREKERSRGTREQYLRAVKRFLSDTGGAEPTREAAAEWRDGLLRQGYAAPTVNAMVAAVNAYFDYLGRPELRVKALRVQRSVFRKQSRELTGEEYGRLLAAAPERLRLIMETVCSTGIRVSELRYITVEAARAGEARISLKGKLRTVLMPSKLCRKLLKYAKKQKTASGEIFLTGRGKPLTRGQIWAEMKALAKKTGVEATKIFPHNLRHLFARTFYRVTRDIAKLADVLGHSSIETTRIYLITTGEEHRRALDKLGLVS